MYDAVLACCRWLENTPWGVTVRDSAWMGPVIQWVHFVGLSMWLGTSLTVDLRLMGVGERRLTAAELSTGLFACTWWFRRKHRRGPEPSKHRRSANGPV